MEEERVEAVDCTCTQPHLCFSFLFAHILTQINNGIAGRRVSHCLFDLLFPAGRIEQGGGTGGEKGCLDE